MNVQSIDNWERISGRNPTTVIICGEVIEIRPYKMGQLKTVLLILHDYLPVFAADVGAGFQKLIGEGMDKVIDLLVLAGTGSKISREFIEALPVDEGVRLFEAVFTVNKDFFTQSVMPQIKRMFPMLEVVTEQVEVMESIDQGVLKAGQTM